MKLKSFILSLNLITFAAPEGGLVTINPAEVVSTRAPHRGFDPDVKCIIHMADGKHVAVAEDCQTVNRKLREEED
jgi:hypothetical protein